MNLGPPGYTSALALSPTNYGVTTILVRGLFIFATSMIASSAKIASLSGIQGVIRRM